MKFASQHIPIPVSHSILRRIAGENPVIVNYHMVSDQDLPYVKFLYQYPSQLEFREQVRFYKKHYRLIHLEDLINHVKEGDSLPENALLITFDDGFRQVYENVAPILLDEKVPASFFICPEFIDNKQVNHDNRQSLLISKVKEGMGKGTDDEISALLNESGIPGLNLCEKILHIPYRKRSLIDQIASLAGVDMDGIFQEYSPYLSMEQLRELPGMGFSVGGHSMDHARFVELSLQEQTGQALDSVSWVQKEMGIPYGVFAFPYTDIGVSKEFYNHVSGNLDLIFGTQGFMKDPVPYSFQRINAEKFGFSAKRNLKYQFVRKIIKARLGRNSIRRN